MKQSINKLLFVGQNWSDCSKRHSRHGSGELAQGRASFNVMSNASTRLHACSSELVMKFRLWARGLNQFWIFKLSHCYVLFVCFNPALVDLCVPLPVCLCTCVYLWIYRVWAYIPCSLLKLEIKNMTLLYFCNETFFQSTLLRHVFCYSKCGTYTWWIQLKSINSFLLIEWIWPIYSFILNFYN